MGLKKKLNHNHLYLLKSLQLNYYYTFANPLSSIVGAPPFHMNNQSPKVNLWHWWWQHQSQFIEIWMSVYDVISIYQRKKKKKKKEIQPLLVFSLDMHCLTILKYLVCGTYLVHANQGGRGGRPAAGRCIFERTICGRIKFVITTLENQLNIDFFFGFVCLH